MKKIEAPINYRLQMSIQVVAGLEKLEKYSQTGLNLTGVMEVCHQFLPILLYQSLHAELTLEMWKNAFLAACSARGQSDPSDVRLYAICALISF